MWAVLSKEEVPHLKIESSVLACDDGPCGLLELKRLTEAEYTALFIHILPADVAWLDRLSAAAGKLAQELRLETAKAEIKAQMRAEDTEAARLAEKARVADPGYTPTLAEAMRNPAELVAGMIEEGPVHHTSLPPGLTLNCPPKLDAAPPPAPEWKPEDYARCVLADGNGRLEVGRVYQVEAVYPVVVTGQPDHPPMLRLRDAESGPFSADRFEPIDTPF